MYAPAGPVWDIDRKLLLMLNGSWGARWDTFWWTVSQIWCWIPLYALMIFLFYRKYGWRQTLFIVILVVVGMALADQTANFFKNHTPKYRPTYTTMLWEGVPYMERVNTVRDYTGQEYRGGSFGTVSGHAATSMAIALTSAGIYRRRWFSLMAAAYVVLTCYSRLYLGVHFPLDILFGLIAGSLIGLAMLWIWRVVNKRFTGPINENNF